MIGGMNTSASLQVTSTAQMYKQSLRMAWPIAASRLLVAVGNFFAMWLLAHLGHNELAAGALIFVFQTCITVIMASILFALGPLISRAYGAGNPIKIGAVVQQGWFLSILLTLLTVFILSFNRPILLALGQDPALVAIVNEYFGIYIFAVLPMFFFTTNQMFVMGVCRQHLGFAATFLATIVLFLVSYVLCTGHWGFPALGVKGVAYGSLASLWVGMIFSFWVIIKQDFFKQFELFRPRLQHSWHYLQQLFTTGWPIVMQMSCELFCWFLMVIFVGWLGLASLASQQITNQFSILVLIPIMGFSQACSILIGQAAGAKRYHEVKRLGLVNISISVLSMLVVMVFYLAFPKLLLNFYINIDDPANGEIIHLATLVFAVTAFTLTFDAVRNITVGALRGLYDNRYPMYLSIIFMWCLGLPLGYFLAFHAHLGIVGLSLGNLCGVFLVMVWLLWRWHKHSSHLLIKAEANDLATAQQGK